MTNAELDRRIGELVRDAKQLCHDLEASEPNIERAVALGALSGCVVILQSLTTEDHQLTLAVLGLIEVAPPSEGEPS